MYVDDLEGDDLNYWVSRAQGFSHDDSRIFVRQTAFSPCTDWSEGGPIIAKAFITIMPIWGGQRWQAGMVIDLATHKQWWTGRSPLVAAMRCFVGSQFGTTVTPP